MTDHLRLLVALLSHDGRFPDDPLTAPAIMSMLYRRGDEYLHTPPTRIVRPAA